MAEVDKKILEQVRKSPTVYQVCDDEGKPLGVWKGPYLDKYFDNYTEALFENINYRRNELHRQAGLNEHAQTSQQEKEFKQKQKQALDKKEKASIAAEMLSQNK